MNGSKDNPKIEQVRLPLAKMTLSGDLVGSQKPIPDAVLPAIKPRPLNGEDYFDVFVVLASSPSYFIVQSLYFSPLDNLMENMFKFYESKDNRIDLCPNLIVPSHNYCAKWSNRWYRVRVEAVISTMPMMVMCCFLDYGYIHSVPFEDLQPIYSQFCDVPVQAIKASLFNIRAISSDWDVMTCYEFSQLVISKPFVSIVNGIKLHDNQPVLELTLIDTSGESDIMIDQVLIERGFARRP